MSKPNNFSVVNFSREEVPIVTEDRKTRYGWVPVGVHEQDDFFHLLTEAYNTSTTNAACIEGVADLIYGKGLTTDDDSFKDELHRLIPAEDLKRVTFDMKLYGNSAFQVYWNKEHTKIKKFYHVPVQTLRAEKLLDMNRVQAYYYCTDWDDVRRHKEKIRIPAFGTSDEECEILYIKEYEPNRYYYSLPDWISALQYSFTEAELSNLHLNNIENGFLPVAMVNFNNGVPAPEERQTIESLLETKFTGTRNAGRFMVSFNDDAINKPTIDTIPIDNLHEKYTYVAEYAQDRILVAHRIVSPLLFGIRTANNGFSSQSEEMKTAYSIMQTMTIFPFQSLVLNAIDKAFIMGGIGKKDLMFEQLTPLVILSTTADETNQTIQEAEDDVNKQMENENTTDEDMKDEKLTSDEAYKLAYEEKNARFSQPFFKDKFN
tara:strand:+ start:1589 stop:2881 length:1293 start_codon:yes stop_codon:yes gene_type:complete